MVCFSFLVLVDLLFKGTPRPGSSPCSSLAMQGLVGNGETNDRGTGAVVTHRRRQDVIDGLSNALMVDVLRTAMDKRGLKPGLSSELEVRAYAIRHRPWLLQGWSC